MTNEKERRPSDGAEKLSRAVSFRTVSKVERDEIDYREYEKFLEFLREEFPLFFRAAEVETINSYSLLCTLRGEADAGETDAGEADAGETDPSEIDKPALFLAHYDVVPPGDEKKWSHPPYSGVVEEDLLWGRGSLDDKGPLVAVLEAVESMLEEGIRPKRSVVFAFGHDEEIGGGEGAKAMAAALAERGLSFSFVLDEGMTMLDPELLPVVDRCMALIGISEKGHVDLRITAEGAPGHSSTPPPSTSAGVLARAICNIEQNPFPARLTPPVEELFRNLASHTNGIQRLLLSRPRLFSPLLTRMLKRGSNGNAMVRTTQAVTMLEGSDKENILPSSSSAVVNCRILPGETLDSVVQRIRRTIDDPRIRVEPIPHLEGNDPLPVSRPHGEGYYHVSEAVSEVYPESIVAPTLVLGTTDSRHYVQLVDDIYRFVPVRINRMLLETIHGYDERIPVGDFHRAVEVYRKILEKL